jgi:cell wall-associated NlpC family hydrolase
MSGSVNDTTAGSLLTATDPSALLQQGTLEEYQSEHQLNAIGQLQRATVAESNAETDARAAVLNQAKATQHAQDAAANAEKAQQDAEDAVTAAQAERAQLLATKASRQRELNSATAHLATLNHQRTKYIAYQRHLRELRRERREARREARRAARQEARRQARLAAQHHHSGGGGGGSTFDPGPTAPVGGGWTAAKGQQAANRALSQLGTPYAWAGGGVYGPTRGVCSPSNGAPNDCYVTGYDCSGLAMYAWGEGWAHYAASQYQTAGHYHPSAGNLLPGDLIFWSFGGAWSIHHVAIYIGNGQIVEAPYSGGYVQTASLYEYGGFYGATRPLT